MTDNDDFNDDKTPFEMAVETVEDMDNDNERNDPYLRILDALALITMSVRNIKKAAFEMKHKEIH